jgi:uncharacterized membrane protein YkoI
MNEHNDTSIQPTTADSSEKPRRSRKKVLWIGAAVAAALSIGGLGTAVAADQVGDDEDALSGDTLQRATDKAIAETGGGEVIDAEREDDGGYEVEVRLPDGGERDVHLNEDYTVREVKTDDRDRNDSDDRDGAGRNDSDDRGDSDRLTGDALKRAEQAALAETGGGTVTDAERDDDGGFEVDVRLEDGSEADVDLNDDFTVRAVDRDDD